MIRRSHRTAYTTLVDHLLHVMGIGSAAALAALAPACGGSVVFDGLEGSGGVGGAGTTGATTGQTNGATTTVGPTGSSSTGQVFTCDVEVIPENQLVYACLPPDPGPPGCPPKESAQVFEGLSKQLNMEVPGCETDFCYCSNSVTSVPCGPDPNAQGGACCYYAVVAYSELCEGRPFTVDGAARVASLARRADWSDPTGSAPDLTGLDAATRRALAEAWARDGLFEHASVASFARFVLELLAVGAPAELVADAQRAMGDEIRHARLCLALAGAYAGAPVGPGPLGLDAALDGRDDPCVSAVAAVTEGCVNETLAALLAGAARDAAEDPAVRAALDVIAADEAAHAALAWRYVAWAYRAGDARLKAAVRQALSAAAAQLTLGNEPDPGADPAVLRAHGRLTLAEQREVVRRGFDEVVRPAARALLADAVGSDVAVSSSPPA